MKIFMGKGSGGQNFILEGTAIKGKKLWIHNNSVKCESFDVSRSCILKFPYEYPVLSSLSECIEPSYSSMC